MDELSIAFAAGALSGMVAIHLVHLLKFLHMNRNYRLADLEELVLHDHEVASHPGDMSVKRRLVGFTAARLENGQRDRALFAGVVDDCRNDGISVVAMLILIKMIVLMLELWFTRHGEM